MSRRCLTALAAFLILPATAQAATKFETYSVPSVDGSRIHIEVARPDDKGPTPVILTYSPYNSLSDPAAPGSNIANDSLFETYAPKGYARAYADVIGTRNSTGCWDYGGAKEIASGVDVVNFLARQPWTNGKVAMIGGSYEGTTANMVAAQGDRAPGLASIVPQAAISRWYGYAYQDGVRYLGNSKVPTDEGFDTPLAFDLGFGRTPPTQIGPAALEVMRARANECNTREHTEKGYDRTPDYDAFWLERDYLKDAKNVKVPSLVTHGWQDYNVKQSEGTDFFEALPNAPFKKLFVYQAPHSSPSTAAWPQYHALLERFFARTLKGVQNGVENEPPVLSEGRVGESGKVKLKGEESWPPRGTRTLSLDLGRGTDGGVLGVPHAGEDAYTDRANTNEETVARNPRAEQTWRYYVSEPLKSDIRIAGSAVLDTLLKTSAARGQMSPVVFDVPASGNPTVISRGHLNLQYKDGLSKAVPPPVGAPYRARTRLAPQDQTVEKGHRIGLMVASSNVAWALPDDPNVGVTVVRGGQSRLVLPFVGANDAVPGGRIGENVTGGGLGALIGAAPSLSRPVPAGTRAARRSRLSLHIWRLRRNRLRLYGRAARNARVSFRITVRGRRSVTRRIRVRSRTGVFRFVVRVPRRRAVRVTASLVGVRGVKVTRRLSSRQIGNRPR